jgi:hypothetical protein
MINAGAARYLLDLRLARRLCLSFRLPQNVDIPRILGLTILVTPGVKARWAVSIPRLSNYGLIHHRPVERQHGLLLL